MPHIHVDSSDLDVNGRVRLNSPIHARRIIVRSVTVPRTFYAINSTNNTLLFDRGGVKTATVTPGNYTAAELAAELQSKMLAADSNAYVVTIDSITRHFTIAGTAGFTIESSSLILGILGMAAATSATSHTSTSSWVMNPYFYLFLKSSELAARVGRGSHSTTGEENILTRINVTTDDVIQEYFEDEFLFATDRQPIKTFDMTICAKNNETISFNGASWAVTLYWD